MRRYWPAHEIGGVVYPTVSAVSIYAIVIIVLRYYSFKRCVCLRGRAASRENGMTVSGRPAESVGQRVRRAFGEFYVQGLQSVGQAVVIGDDHQQVNNSGVADNAPQGLKGGVGDPVLAQ